MQEEGSLPHHYLIKQYVVYSQQKAIMAQPAEFAAINGLEGQESHPVDIADLAGIAGIPAITSLEAAAATAEAALIEQGLTPEKIEAINETAQEAIGDLLKGDPTQFIDLKKKSENGHAESRFAVILALIIITIVFFAACATIPLEPGVTSFPTQTVQIEESPTPFEAQTAIPLTPTPTFEAPASITAEVALTRIPDGVIGGDWTELSPELKEYYEMCFAETGITGGKPSEAVISNPAFLSHFGGDANPFFRFRNLPGTDEYANFADAEYGSHDALLCGFDDGGQAQYLIFTHPSGAVVTGLEVQGDQEGSVLTPSNLDIQYEIFDPDGETTIEEIFDVPGMFGLTWTNTDTSGKYYLLYDPDKGVYVFVTKEQYETERAAMLGLPAPEVEPTEPAIEPTEVTPPESPTATPTVDITSTQIQETRDTYERTPANADEARIMELFLEQFANGPLEKSTFYGMILEHAGTSFERFNLQDISVRARIDANYFDSNGDQRTISIPAWMEKTMNDGTIKVIAIKDGGGYFSFNLPEGVTFDDAAVQNMVNSALTPGKNEFFSVSFLSFNQSSVNSAITPEQEEIYASLIAAYDADVSSFVETGDNSVLVEVVIDDLSYRFMFPMLVNASVH